MGGNVCRRFSVELTRTHATGESFALKKKFFRLPSEAVKESGKERFPLSETVVCGDERWRLLKRIKTG